MTELKPTPQHLMDPYVLQLIEALSRRDDEIEDLTAVVDIARSLSKCAGYGGWDLQDAYSRLKKSLAALEKTDASGPHSIGYTAESPTSGICCDNYKPRIRPEVTYCANCGAESSGIKEG